jgi:PAS domain S-box-containing protein
MRKIFIKKNTTATETPKDSPILESFIGNSGADEKLIESEIRYRRLFESAKDGILIIDFETGKITDANPFIIKIIDLPLKEILGKKLWEIGLFSNKEESEDAFIKLKKNGYVRFEDMPVQRRNGKIIEVEFVSNVYLENNIKVIQCNIRDITERKLAEKKLIEINDRIKKQNSENEKQATELTIANKELTFQNNQKEKLALEYSVINEELIESLNRIQKINNELIIAKARAEESDNLKTAFLANMSHEIRTPMNAIMGFSQVLLQPDLPKIKLEEFVQIINASSLQLLSILNDLIDISKIESGQMSVNSELVNVYHLLNDLFVTYKKSVELKKLSFQYSHDDHTENVQIMTDGNRIKQIFCNLLNNAIKFTKEGKIIFGYKIKKDFIEFYVKDTGIGILPENKEIIFQRFRQLEMTATRNYGGNGLGLSISKALVEKMGGTITVDSECETGSTFIFTIPYAEVFENIGPIITPDSEKYNWIEKTVLLVEDEVNNHAYLEELLSGTNIKLRHAWDGKEALEKVKNHSDISLVLMDFKMPVMDGYKATQLIKKIRPKLPIIAQTAYALSHEREEAIKAGCDHYLTKPIDKHAFMKVLNSYLS